MRYSWIFLLCLVVLPLVSAEIPNYKLGETVNRQIICYDASGNYCTSATVLVANVQYPNGTNALNNQTLTYNPTYFNFLVPTDTLGTGYEVLIHSVTSNNTIAESTYDVTITGERAEIYHLGIVIALLIVAGVFLWVGQTFAAEHWILRTFFNFAAVGMGILAINSSRLIAGSSNSLGKMGSTGLIVGVVIFAFFFLYMFIYYFIETIKTFREKRGVRWEYD